MQQRISRLAIVLFLGDIVLILASLILASGLRITLPIGMTLGPGGEQLPLLVYATALVTWLGTFVLTGVYEVEGSPASRSNLLRLATAAFVATFVFAGVLYFTFRDVSRLQFLYFLAIGLASLMLFRGAVHLLLRWRGSSRILDWRNVIVIGAGQLGSEVLEKVRADPSRGYRIVGFVDEKRRAENQGLLYLGEFEQLRDLIVEHEVEEVWSTLPPHAYDKLHSVIVNLDDVPVRIKVIPDYFALALVKAKIEMIGGIPLIGLREPVIGDLDRLIKRVFDLGIGLTLSLLLLPLMLAIAVAIRLDSKGSVLFRQVRLGENGKTFRMLKFRTMSVEASSRSVDGRPAAEEHKVKDDPRRTRLGASLRRLSLDELPQLFNVLGGEMSMVGPRPEMPWLVDKYAPWQRKRFAVPQGITGWWQINGRSDKPMHQNTDDDLYYVYNYSLLLDIKILLRTPMVVIRGKGAF